MKRRPWSIVILAFLHMISPITDVLISAGLMRMNVIEYLRALFQQKSTLSLLDFFGLMPLAGYSIYSMKKWSYPLFLSITAWEIYCNNVTWHEYPNIVSFPVITAFHVVNALVVGYFLIPSVRAPYFNPRLRWWESKPRYTIPIDSVVEFEGGKRKATITNISEGGVFLKAEEKFGIGDAVQLEFSFFRLRFRVRGRVMYSLAGGAGGCGIQFESDRDSSRKLKSLVTALDALGVERRPEHTSSLKSLREWWITLIKTGKGLLPELPSAKAVLKGTEKE